MCFLSFFVCPIGGNNYNYVQFSLCVLACLYLFYASSLFLQCLICVGCVGVHGVYYSLSSSSLSFNSTLQLPHSLLGHLMTGKQSINAASLNIITCL